MKKEQNNVKNCGKVKNCSKNCCKNGAKAEKQSNEND